MDTGLFILAISILIVCYAGMHYYLYRKLCWIFPRRKKIIIISLYVLASSLFIVEALTHTGFSRFTTPLAWISSVWIGYIFIFFAFSATLDLAIRLLALFYKNQLPLPFKQSSASIFSAVMVILICIGGFISAQQINILEHTLSSKKLQQPITIVQITDLHLGQLTSKARMQKLVDEINALNADIIVSTGDLVDMQLDNLDGLSATIANMKAKHGNYAVYGNHEALAGIEESKVFAENAGFTVLSNRGITIDHLINIVGVDDPAVHGKIQTSGKQEKLLLEKFSPDLFTLFLKHQPVVTAETRGLFDLQLSGHTHGGQIFPFSLLTKIFYSSPFGLSQIGNTDSWLYVSKGTGSWGPPIRVLAKPEVSIFYLKPTSDHEIH